MHMLTHTLKHTRWLCTCWANTDALIPVKLVGPESQTELVRVIERAMVDTVLNTIDVLQVAIAEADSKSPTWVQLGSLDLCQHVAWRFNDSTPWRTSLLFYKELSLMKPMPRTVSLTVDRDGESSSYVRNHKPGLSRSS